MAKPLDILVLDDKDHAKNQVERCIQTDGAFEYRITWLDSAAKLDSVAGREFDIAFVDFFLDRDRAYGADQLGRIKSKRLVGFSSKLAASELIENAAKALGFAETAAIEKIKTELGNPMLEAYFRALPAGRPGDKPLWIYCQSGVVPILRDEGSSSIVLVTSRKSGEWIVPKGVVERNMSPEESALKEAREEAGIEGVIEGPELGSYRYEKWGDVCSVALFPMRVDMVMQEWPERGQRKRATLPLVEALAAIANPDIRALVAKAAAALPPGV